MPRPYHKRANPLALDVVTGADKWCPRCEQYKPPAEWNKNVARADGLSVYCRECNRANHRDYCKRKPHIIRRVSARWRANNKEHDKIRKRIQWLHKHGRKATPAEYERLIQTHPKLGKHYGSQKL